MEKRYGLPTATCMVVGIVIGSGVFFDGAEKELIGVLPGETKEISVVFPEGYPQAELSGKSSGL